MVAPYFADRAPHPGIPDGRGTSERPPLSYRIPTPSDGGFSRLCSWRLDSTPGRTAWSGRPGTCLFEIDQTKLLAYKQEILDRAGAAPACTRIPVAADLREEWPAVLLAAGFRPDEPVVWLAEGLLFYLPEAAVRTLLMTMASLSAPASLLEPTPSRRPYLPRRSAAPGSSSTPTQEPPSSSAPTIPRALSARAAGNQSSTWPENSAPTTVDHSHSPNRPAHHQG
jgi:hypothetical protein